MKTKYIFLVILSLAVHPAFPQEGMGRRYDRESDQQGNIEMLLNSREFFFRPRSALPTGGTSIDLTTHRSFVKFNPEEIESFMPFFGRAYSGVGFDDPGLHFKGKPQGFEVEKRRRNYQVSATVRAEHDIFRLFLNVSPDGNATLSISSNNRESMSYQGEVISEMD